MKPNVLTICVNYHNEEETIRFVRHLLAQNADFPHHIIIVDNNEDTKISDLSVELGNNRCIFIYHDGKNRGYFGAANWGFQQYLRAKQLPEWIIVCNTDVYFESNNSLSELVNLYKGEQASIIAPAIISERTGLDQNPFMKKRPSAIRMHLYRIVFYYAIVANLYQSLSLVKTKLRNVLNKKRKHLYDGNKMQIYAPHGAFIIFNRSYFIEGGNLDYGSFLYGEEIFVAETALKLGHKVIYDPRVRVVHKEHTTTKNLKKRNYYKYKSSEYCAKKYFKI